VIDTKYVARCGFCNKGIRRVYRSEVVLEDHVWFCSYVCRKKHEAGYLYVSPWKSGTAYYAVLALIAVLLLAYAVGR
jgi:hypothetical protein